MARLATIPAASPHVAPPPPARRRHPPSVRPRTNSAAVRTGRAPPAVTASASAWATRAIGSAGRRVATTRAERHGSGSPAVLFTYSAAPARTLGPGWLRVCCSGWASGFTFTLSGTPVLLCATVSISETIRALHYLNIVALCSVLGQRSCVCVHVYRMRASSPGQVLHHSIRKGIRR